MDYTSSAQFVSSLVKSLHQLCNGYVEFDTWVQVTGTLYMHTDMGKSIEFVIDEKVFKPDDLSVLTVKPVDEAKAIQEWEFSTVEQAGLEPQIIEPQGANIHDLVQAAEQNFHLVYNEVTEASDVVDPESQEFKVVPTAVEIPELAFVKEENFEEKVLPIIQQLPIEPQDLVQPPPTRRSNFGVKRKKVKDYPVGEGPFKCLVCNKGFTRESTLKVHKRLHTGERPYKCEVCDARFNTSQDLRVHFRTHSGEKPYKCRVCGEGFAQYGTVQRHELTHTAESADKTHICDTCGKGFDRKDSLLRHKRLHLNEKANKCRVCDQVFANKMELVIHRSKHKHAKNRLKDTGDMDVDTLKENGNVCAECGKWFDKKSKLESHRKIHDAERNNTCLICGETFGNKMELVIHKSKHVKPSSALKFS